MSVYYEDASVVVHHGDCLDVLRGLPDASVDCVVTDPPYGLEFMGKEWDRFGGGPARFRDATAADAKTDGITRGSMPDTYRAGAPFQSWCESWAVECLRVLRPGGHLLAFGGTRTSHRLTCGIEDAGFEIRDAIGSGTGQLAWVYGSGFPKSLDVGKAIDKANGRQFEDRLALGRHIREQREALGLSRAEVNGWLGAATKCEHYESDSPGFARVPTLADWHVIQDRLGLSDEHLALVEREEAERDVIGSRRAPGGEWTAEGRRRGGVGGYDIPITAPATNDARTWDGWGTALKPSWEPIVVARKPLAAGTVAANVLRFGTGALNIDACRIAGDVPSVPQPVYGVNPAGVTDFGSGVGRNGQMSSAPGGRWPANVVLDGRAAAALDTQSGETTSKPGGVAGWQDEYVGGTYRPIARTGHDDSGGASRFFHVAADDDPLPIDTLGDRFRYVAKADASERPRVPKAGEDAAWKASGIRKRCVKCGKQQVNMGASACACPEPEFAPDPSMSGHVSHPTVKPLDLMRWLVRLVTPPGGTCLDPFAGSGTTVEACILEGFRCVAIEREAEYLPLIEARVTRQRDPVRHIELTGGDLGLFDLGETT